MELEEYQFNFQHIPGKQNILVDYLSRTPTDKNSTDLRSDPRILHKEVLPIVEQEEK